jgi:hypothetical protein
METGVPEWKYLFSRPEMPAGCVPEAFASVAKPIGVEEVALPSAASGAADWRPGHFSR